MSQAAVKRPHPRAIHFFSSLLLSAAEGEKAVLFWEKVKAADKIVITSHISPDGDAIGSLLGMYHTLRALGKSPTMVSHDPVPAYFAFLPGSDLVISPDDYQGDPELIVIVDCSHPSRVGPRSMKIVERAESIAVIDHHEDSDSVAGIHIVDTRASAAGEIIFRLIKHGGQVVTAETALCLYVAILTDTGSFRHGNTSSVAFSIASELMQTGAIDMHSIGVNIFARDTIPRLHLRGMVFDRTEIRDGIIYSFITPEMIEESGATVNEAEGCIDDLSLCRDAEIAIIFWEEPSCIRVQLRSIRERDVLDIGRAIGGGGHKRAAGGRMPGISVEEAMERVFAAATGSIPA